MILTKRSRHIALGIILVLLLALLLPSVAFAEETDEAAPLNDACTLDWEGFCNYPSRLSDFRWQTVAKLKDGSKGTIYWTDDQKADIVYWEWTIPPESCTFEFLDEYREVIETQERKLEGVRGYLYVPEGCYGVRLTAHDTCELSEWHIYDEDRLPENVLLWEPAPEKCDIMLIVAHSDDELVMMGGIIPTYAAELGYRVQVVYCYVPDFTRHAEALGGLRCNGMTTLPVIFVTEDEDNLRFYEKITEVIRRFQPEVVITHDIDGEYGNPGHVLVSRDVRRAVETSNDPEKFPESAKTYGTWEVKKLYIHLYEENQIRMDFDKPLEAFDGKTAFEMAQLGYAYHPSQRSDWLKQLQSNRWDCRLYGLYSSTVGEDVEKNDFLENIPKELLSNYVAPTPEPTATPEPTPSPTPQPTVEPTHTPAPTHSPEPEVKVDMDKEDLAILLAAAVMLCALLVLNIMRAAQSKRGNSGHNG